MGESVRRAKVNERNERGGGGAREGKTDCVSLMCKQNVKVSFLLLFLWHFYEGSFVCVCIASVRQREWHTLRARYTRHAQPKPYSTERTHSKLVYEVTK